VPRLFVAVIPPDDVVAELMQLRRKDQRGVRFVPPERWHVTLRFLGEADPDEVADALAGVHLDPAVALVGPGVDLLGERALVVPVQGVDRLAMTVTERTAHLGEPPRQRFTGHLTLARLKPGADLPPALGAFVRAEFDVDEVVLVSSRLDPDGARYDPITSWPLATAPDPADRQP